MKVVEKFLCPKPLQGNLLLLHKIDREQWKNFRPKKQRGSESGQKRPDPDRRYLKFNESWQYENKDKQILSV